MTCKLASKRLLALAAGALIAAAAPLALAQDDEKPAEAEAGAEATAGADTAAAGGEADAAKGGDAKFPVPFVKRPLTLPQMMLAPEVGFGLYKIFGFNDLLVGAHIGASFGVLDDLQVDATVAPILFSPDFQYSDPSLGATYRFLSGDVEVGGSLRVFIPTEGDFRLNFGVPVLIRAGDIVRIDTGVQATLTFGGDTTFGLIGQRGFRFEPGVPIDVAVQIMDPLFVGVSTGFIVLDFSNTDTLAVPLGARAGFTIESDNKPFIDLDARFDFPFFLAPASDDVVITDVIHAGLNARAYFQL